MVDAMPMQSVHTMQQPMQSNAHARLAIQLLGPDPLSHAQVKPATKSTVSKLNLFQIAVK